MGSYYYGRLKSIRTTAAALFLGLGVLAGCGQTGNKAPLEITVYAAASLTDVLEESDSLFTGHTGIKAVFEFGSSGSLAKKIEAGAPVDIFISADVKWIDYLNGKSLLIADSRRLIARTSLVCIQPVGSADKLTGPQDLVGPDRISVGDPGHVPAGTYAQEALGAYALWDTLSRANKLVLGQDVRAVLSFVEQDQVQAGIVYLTDARLSDKVKVAFTFPDSTHKPVAYYGAVVSASGKAGPAGKYLDFLETENFHAVLARRGFSLP